MIDFENLSKVIAIFVIMINLLFVAVSNYAIDEDGNPVLNVGGVDSDSVYDYNSILVDVNSLDLSDSNTLQTFVSNTDIANPAGNLLFITSSTGIIGGLIFNIMFALQVYILWLFNSFGMGLYAFVFIIPFTAIEIYGLFRLILGVFSVVRGGGGL